MAYTTTHIPNIPNPPSMFDGYLICTPGTPAGTSPWAPGGAVAPPDALALHGPRQRVLPFGAGETGGHRDLALALRRVFGVSKNGV